MPIDFYRSKKEGVAICNQCEEQLRFKAEKQHLFLRELSNIHFWKLSSNINVKDIRCYCRTCNAYRSTITKNRMVSKSRNEKEF
jgi:hypothetical protein